MTVKGLVISTLAAASALTATLAFADLLFLGPDIIRDEGHENVTRLMRLRAGGEETGSTVATGGSSGNRAVGRGRGVERRAFAPSFSSLDIEDASLLRIVLSVSEPRNRRLEDLILNDLTLRLQDGSGGQAPGTFSTGRRYRLHSIQLNGNQGRQPTCSSLPASAQLASLREGEYAASTDPPGKVLAAKLRPQFRGNTNGQGGRSRS